MANNQEPMEEQLRVASQRATEELAAIRATDGILTPRMLVRRAMLLQLEDAPDGTAEEIEQTLKAALNLDEQCIEAHLELGRFYYAVLDDAGRAKHAFLRALNLLAPLNEEVIKGLLDCDAELAPGQNEASVKVAYEAKLLHKIVKT